MPAAGVPLCVDLDGTLLRSDSLIESLLLFLKRRPLQVWRLLPWLVRGRAHLKQELALRAPPEPAQLPLNELLLRALREVRSSGRPLILATASDQRIARGIAEHLGIFESVLASDGVTNLDGERKRAALVARFGEQGFDYAGNSHADLAVWRSSRKALVVGSHRLRRDAARVSEVAAHIELPTLAVGALLKALRPHQWVKNILVFVPVLLAQQLAQPATLVSALLAFLAFCLCASAVYVFNDLLDLESDRAHPRKRLRPFASGELNLGAGLLAIPTLLAGAFAIASALPADFIALLAAYFICTLAYSLRLKQAPMLDVLLLAGLYSARVLAGGFATGIELSFWLLAFSAFLFLSLAIVKRSTELRQLLRDAPGHAPGRGYHTDDLPLLSSVGIAAGFGAVLVLALYINSPQSQALYAHARMLWALCPLVLLWLSRVWLLAHRGQMHDDPIVFALRDRYSLLIGAAFVAAILLAA